MKTQDFIPSLQETKRKVRKMGMIMMLSKMVADNIADLIPDQWEIIPFGFVSAFKIQPKEGIEITADKFEKFVYKLARAFNKEPNISIDESIMEADFYVYVSGGNSDFAGRYESVMIEIIVGNTEKCEIVYKEKMTKVAELTGYCKALKEKKYLTTVEK